MAAIIFLPLLFLIYLYKLSTHLLTLDRHAPLKMKKVPDKIKLPWFSDEIATSISKRSKAERRWYALRSDTTRFLEFYRTQSMVGNLLDEAERKYYHTQLQDNNTTILKEVLPSIGPLFTSVVNESTQTGVFPQDLKEALVKLLLKKANLEL